VSEKQTSPRPDQSTRKNRAIQHRKLFIDCVSYALELVSTADLMTMLVLLVIKLGLSLWSRSQGQRETDGLPQKRNHRG